MCNSEAPTHGKLNLKSLLICWLIILGGYLLIRMVFLVFGLQLHLTSQGACLALLPYCFGALYLWRCCKNREPLFYALGILLPAIVEKLTLYFLGAYLCGVSPFRVTAVMEAIGTIEPYAVLFTRMPMRYAVNLLFLTGHTFFAASPSLHSAFWACLSFKSGWGMNHRQDIGAAKCYQGNMRPLEVRIHQIYFQCVDDILLVIANQNVVHGTPPLMAL